MRTTIVITMAGLGSRFRAVGHTVPKYEIKVCGRTLFSWSVGSLQNFTCADDHYIFVCLRESQARPFIATQLRELGIEEWDVVELPQLTDGQATSALLAGSALKDAAAPMLVYNIDTYVEPIFLQPFDFTGDGWIPCFEGSGDAWSFVKTGDDGRVVDVREKERISPYATIGLYGFSSFRLYEDTYRDFFADAANMVHGERYIAPMYNHLVRQGREVRMSLVPIDAVHALGTPQDVERFAAEMRS